MSEEDKNTFIPPPDARRISRERVLAVPLPGPETPLGIGDDEWPISMQRAKLITGRRALSLPLLPSVCVAATCKLCVESHSLLLSHMA